MKKVFESPKLELCEFVVAARLSGSGLGTGHDNGQNSACSMVSSAGSNECDLPSNSNSGPTIGTCL
jgi:hypothetical protein